MSRYLCIALVASAIATGAQAQATSPPDAARLQQVLDAWGSLDVTKPAVYYAKDAGLAFYDVAPRKYSGWTEYAAGAGALFKGLKSLSFQLGSDATVHRSGDMAWATALVDGTMVGQDGTATRLEGRWTTIWEKRGNNWLIVHDHFSVPPPEPAKQP